MKKTNSKRGFTIIEALMASVLIAIAISALIAANTAMSNVNAAGANLSTAEYLLQQVRERTETTGYQYLRNMYNDKVYSPPVDEDGDELTAFNAYSQHIGVAYVANDNFDETVDEDEGFLKITAEVRYNGEPITSSSWIRAEY